MYVDVLRLIHGRKNRTSNPNEGGFKTRHQSEALIGMALEPVGTCGNGIGMLAVDCVRLLRHLQKEPSAMLC